MVRNTLCLLVGLFACGFTSCFGVSLVPDQEQGLVHCDNWYTCPTGTTCCHHPAGGWTCCPFSPARCCLDGYHCCHLGYDCDRTYTHCVRQDLPYPFAPKLPATSRPASRISSDDDKEEFNEIPLTAPVKASDSSVEVGEILCDLTHRCRPGTKCCRGPTGKWTCCPYIFGQCCRDGLHCCPSGYTCSPTSTYCSKGYSVIRSGAPADVQEE